MVEQGSQLFDELVVAIGENPDKKYTFSLAERLSMLKESLVGLATVEVFEHRYLVEYARSIGATHILRGIRTETDYEYERGMRYVNADLDPKISTVFLMPPREIAEVSSSLVKGLVGPIGWEDIVKRYVPSAVFNRLVTQRTKSKTVADGPHPLHLNASQEALRARWFELWSAIAGGVVLAIGGRLFRDLSEAYDQPHRAYHTLVHIAACLKELDKYALSPEAKTLDLKALEVALWFHDYVYDTRSADNEEASAAVAVQVCEQLARHHPMAQTVANLILETKHGVAPKEPLAASMVDIDLSILGADDSVFDEYEQQIRKEYEWVPEEAFRAGRKKILESFLARDTIYSTEFFRQRYENKARKNLERSIKKLGGV